MTIEYFLFFPPLFFNFWVLKSYLFYYRTSNYFHWTYQEPQLPILEPRIRTMCSRDTKTIRICRSILHGSFASTNANWPAKCCRKCSSRPIAKLRHLLLMIIFFSLKFREYEGQKLRTKLGDLLLFSPRSPNSFLSCTLHFSKINISIASTKLFFSWGVYFW